MEVPRHWRLKKQRYALMGETCPHCKSQIFPPRAVCPYCQDETHNQSLYIHRDQSMVYKSQVQAVKL